MSSAGCDYLSIAVCQVGIEPNRCAPTPGRCFLTATLASAAPVSTRLCRFLGSATSTRFESRCAAGTRSTPRFRPEAKDFAANAPVSRVDMVAFVGGTVQRGTELDAFILCILWTFASTRCPCGSRSSAGDLAGGLPGRRPDWSLIRQPSSSDRKRLRRAYQAASSSILTVQHLCTRPARDVRTGCAGRRPSRRVATSTVPAEIRNVGQKMFEMAHSSTSSA